MKANRDYMDLALSAVDRARKSGADVAEAYVSDAESVQISVSNRQVEQVNAVREAGIGLRLLKDQKMVSGSTNELSREAMRSLVADLMRKVPFHTADEYHLITGKESPALERPWSTYADAITYDPRIAEVPVQEKIRLALRMEEAGLGFSPKVSGSMMVVYQDSTSFLYLANSNGIAGWFPTAGCGGGAEMAAADGSDHQSGSHFKAVAQYADFDPQEVGRLAAEKAVKMLGAKPIASCEIPMVIAPEVGTEIFAFLAGMLSADEVQKGRSLFAGKLESQVAAGNFTLVDDGRRKGGLSTAPVDGEGVPQQTTPLMVNGVLKGYLYDNYAAKKGKTRSTGNRSRGSYGSAGSIGPTNLYLQPGTAKPEEILAGIKRGFFLTQAIGIFAGINTASGDFSIPAAGFLIEQGKISKPVRGISIGGNLFKLLKSVDAIGADLTWFQALGCPTFSVASVTIGGVAR